MSKKDYEMIIATREYLLKWFEENDFKDFNCLSIKKFDSSKVICKNCCVSKRDRTIYPNCNDFENHLKNIAKRKRKLKKLLEQ